MGETVYILCALTSLVCFWLLYKSYLRSQSRLLFWSSLCFLGLALNNIILIFDLVLIPSWDLSTLRILPAFLGLAALIYGLVTEVL